MNGRGIRPNGAPSPLMFSGKATGEWKPKLICRPATDCALRLRDAPVVGSGSINSRASGNHLDSKEFKSARNLAHPFSQQHKFLTSALFQESGWPLERTEDSAQRFVRSGTILVTCSGAVGRTTISHAPHENTLITHDLLRVEPRDAAMWGWLYAYLRSPQARAIMVGSHYGHMIKHLETSHLDALPIPIVRSQIAAEFKRT